jgi:hypothetical protein
VGIDQLLHAFYATCASGRAGTLGGQERVNYVGTLGATDPQEPA